MSREGAAERWILSLTRFFLLKLLLLLFVSDLFKSSSAFAALRETQHWPRRCSTSSSTWRRASRMALSSLGWRPGFTAPKGLGGNDDAEDSGKVSFSRQSAPLSWVLARYFFFFLSFFSSYRRIQNWDIYFWSEFALIRNTWRPPTVPFIGYFQRYVYAHAWLRFQPRFLVARREFSSAR